MNSTEEVLQVVAHVVSEKKRECGCVESMTARVVLRDESGFFRAVLAVGEPQKNADMAIENAIRVYEKAVRTS